MNNILRCWFHLTIVVAMISALFLLIPILRQQQQEQHEQLHYYHHQFNSSSSSSRTTNNGNNNINENVDNDNDRNSSIEMGAALFIAPFLKEFNRKYYRQEENSNNKAHPSLSSSSFSSSSYYCDHDYTSLSILEEWKNSHQELLCNFNYSNNNDNNDSTSTTTLIDSSEVENATSMLLVNVKEYILQRWEGQPTIRRYSYSYSNINASSLSSSTTIMMTSIITGSPFLLYNCSSITSSASTSASASASNNSTSRRHHHHRPETATTTTTIATSTGNEINNVTKPPPPLPPPPPTIIRIGPLFDIHNSYERFHAYLNLAMMMIMLDIRNPQLLIITTSSSSNNKNVEDHEMWKLFSNQYAPIYQYQSTNNEFQNENEKTNTTATSSYNNPQIENDELLLLLLLQQQQQQQHYGNRSSGRIDIIDASHITRSGLSILNTKIKIKNNDSHYESSKLKGGRAVDHHCTSILFQGIIEWIKIKIGNVVNVKVEEEEVIEEDEEEQQQQNKDEYETETENEMNNSKDKDNTIIQILWSSRGPYCCQNNGQLYTPDRMIRNETLLIKKIEHRLNNYIVDNNTSTSSTNTNKSHILVGIHGAGLIWSTFLLRRQQKQQKQQNNNKHNNNSALVPGGSTIIRPGLVEIFAGNRPPMNRHYHNLASLCNIQYQSTKHYWKGSNKYVRWTDNHVNEVVDSIKAIIIV
ncbi:hypothetical protein FRACYDRAFT_238496 [Fragilariopsis cylindrus CCMP1102]|uniref:Uncharacterized protein n=1 Tax=Fragilariopsis cylindrus CCMP1102 TaxID=635003 RepID=A0A1E7FJY1_9STRA|nr:hypothetical protein FRACYDRAFT_238496 [Fragilariopsis cylindrus CCMP1102]|eukprot:OEU18063.1 hypothetical protein FRACYDRAFT_238496 [Fragilariopsis cylindrus CCMP1102]